MQPPRQCNFITSALAAFLGLSFMTTAVTAQDALFIDNMGNIGAGTNNPATQLHLRDESGNSALRVDNAAAPPELRVMFELINNGDPLFLFTDTESGNSASFRLIGPNDDFGITHIGTGGVDLRLRRNGNLDISGTLSQNSDRSTKTLITDIDGEVLLARLMQLPVSRWQYKKDPGVEHLGPMAQDFHATFELGDDATRVAPADMAGVSLAATKALVARLKMQQDRLEDQDARIATLEVELSEARAERKAIESLTSRIETLESERALRFTYWQVR